MLSTFLMLHLEHHHSFFFLESCHKIYMVLMKLKNFTDESYNISPRDLFPMTIKTNVFCVYDNHDMLTMSKHDLRNGESVIA